MRRGKDTSLVWRANRMKLYSSDDTYKLYHGNMLDMLEIIEPNSIDACLTDPPYELNFMGKGWDNSGIAFQKETWEKCLQVLKPGGYLLAFGGSRTYHRIAVAIEDAGFEIRDTIIWMYGSGFPKSMSLGKSIESKLVNGSANPTEFKRLDGTKVESGNWGISKMANEQGARPSDYSADEHLRTVDVNYTTEEGKQWDGWGTCLKPSFEPIIVARKPCEGTVTDNVLKWGVGGLNIDECRIPTSEYIYNHGNSNGTIDSYSVGNFKRSIKGENKSTELGRFPANTILTYDDTDFEEVCGGFPQTSSNGGNASMPKMGGGELGVCNYQTVGADRVQTDYVSPKDSGSAARYFYTAKASKRDRDDGLKILETKIKVFNGKSDKSSKEIKDVEQRFTTQGKNVHPTVKPCDLMQYLIRLVTPKGGTVLDPFNGSGSTGKALVWENRDRNKGYKYIGIELTEEYLPIAKLRIEYAEGVEYIAVEDENQEKQIIKRKKPKQRKLFG